MNEIVKEIAEDISKQMMLLDRKREREAIKAVLPKPGDKRTGLLRKEIAKKTNLPPPEVGRHLQAPRRKGEVRCYQRRWRLVKVIQ